MRVYKYLIINRLSGPALEKNRGWHIMKSLDIDLMRKGAKILVELVTFLLLEKVVVEQKSDKDLKIS